MKQLQIDRTKLKSIQEYAKLMGVERQTVYNWIKDKDRNITVIVISGKKFIQI